MLYLASRATNGIARLFAALLVLIGYVCSADAQNTAFATKAKNAILLDYDTGSILFQQNADELAPPASMSKLMTLAVVFRAMKRGQIKLEDEFTMSVNAWRTGGAPSGTAAMFVPVNTKARLDELLQGIIVQSGNDACIALAEALAGNEKAFAEQMTQEARRIGLTKSTFRNSTGLSEPEHLMTARELAALARFIIKEYPEHYAIFGQREFNYRKHKFYNRNPLLSAEIGVDGLKTGHTKEAGYGIVASAVQDGKRLISVLGGMDSENERKDEARKILEWGFRSFTRFKLYDAEEVVGHARVWGGDRFYVPLTGDGDLMVILPRSASNQKLQGEIIYQGPLKPPIKKGDVVATLRVTSATSATSEVPLHAAQDVPKGSFARRGIDSLLHLALKWASL